MVEVTTVARNGGGNHNHHHHSPSPGERFTNIAEYFEPEGSSGKCLVKRTEQLSMSTITFDSLMGSL